MTQTTLADACAAAYIRHGMSAPEASAATAATLALEAVTLGDDGKLMPGKSEAMALATFIPTAMRSELAQRAMDTKKTPHERVTAFVQAMGAQDFDDAMGLGSGGMTREIGEQVNGQIANMEATWARTAERLGMPGVTLTDALP